jgi:hypothetical protein
MKVLILQVNANNKSGYEYGFKDIQEQNFNEILQNSVKKYCKKYNYEYTLVKEKPDNYDISWFRDLSSPNREINTTLIRYYYMFVEGYDAVVSLDNDIYITNHAKPLPKISGHMGVYDTKEYCYDKGSINFKRYYDKLELDKTGFINGGVQMVDALTGSMIKNFFAQICSKRVFPLFDYYSDQNYMNYFRHKYPEKATVLDKSWNFLVSRYKYENYSNINFVHYSGVFGRRIFHRDLKEGLITS